MAKTDRTKKSRQDRRILPKILLITEIKRTRAGVDARLARRQLTALAALTNASRKGADRG